MDRIPAWPGNFFYFSPRARLKKISDTRQEISLTKKYSPVCPMCICTKTIRDRDSLFFFPHLQHPDSLNDCATSTPVETVGIFLVRLALGLAYSGGGKLFF